MHTEIAVFFEEHHLPGDLVAPLVARLASGSLVPRLGGRGTADPPVLEGNETLATDDELVTDTVTQAVLPARYDDLGMLGVGGMGEVRRVRDRDLGRTCAFKVIRPDMANKPNVAARFVEEAQVAAQLQHPNIAPVYDAGRLPDGRAWFTMKEVRGRTLTQLIRELHQGELSEAGFKRLGDVFAKVCDAVGYAHARGVVHRDLKPENVMVGAHGECLVLDWGLAKVVGPDRLASEDRLEPERVVDRLGEDSVVTSRWGGDAARTRLGGVLGTAAYMPPEQARGEVDKLDVRSDVYALGAILYEVLAGRPPYEGRDAAAVLRQVLDGPPEPPGRRARRSVRPTFAPGAFDEAEALATRGAALPVELSSLCERCMARSPGDRPSDGAAVAVEVRAWLDGARKREQALEVVGSADAVVAEMRALQERATELRVEGAALLAPVRPWAPEEDKAAGWAKQDEAEQTERASSLLELKRETLLQAALTHAPELPEAHAALVELELSRHRVAEEAREPWAEARAQVRLREHADALPQDHEVRRRAAAYLRGDGALTLHTDVAGAEVELQRYEVRNRRLVAVPVGALGRTPLRQVSLPIGSYLCVLRHPGRSEVRYPVSVGRGEHWDGVAPGEQEPRPVRLPRLGELGPDDCLVPAGWFWSGGDAEAVDSLPRRRLWCDEFVVKRFPVTNREYQAFLDDLVAMGQEALAVRHQPRERAAGEAAAVYGRDAAGRFVLRPDADGDVWKPDWPVCLVDWFGATAYAAWWAGRTGAPWWLPGELEWEKAARGVDGRYFPWGDGFDPSWCCAGVSHPGRPMPAVVDSYPVDTSVYGVRGLAGNVQDWCADEYRRDGPPVRGDTVLPAAPQDRVTDPTVARVHRGGLWSGAARGARCAYRFRYLPPSRGVVLGFRLAFRPVPTPESG